MSLFTREWVSPSDLSCFTDSLLQNMHRRALLFIDNRQFVGFLQKQKTKWHLQTLTYRHVLCLDQLMKHQAFFTIKAKLKLAIKLITIFLLFGRDTIWRVAKGGKL